ncbi:MAG: hypothetical protein ACRC34_04870 [Cetobacterium sp.]
MELTQEINQLFLSCRDKEYIKTNLENLKSYFTIPQNINLLKFALTTNKNFIALKIIEKLGLKVLPYIHINSFTFVSLYWLYRMTILPMHEFNQLSRKFQIMKNFDILQEETEKSFIKLQIEKRRRIYNRRVEVKSPGISRLVKDSNDSMVFIFYLDDLFDIEKYLGPFLDLKEGMFYTDLKSFEEIPNDPEKAKKQNRFKELKGRLVNCAIRNFSSFFSLDSEMQSKLEELMNALSRVRRCGFRYYLCSRRPLSSIATFSYLFINCIDLTKLVEIKDWKDLNLPVQGKRVIFGGEGNVSYRFLKETMNSLSKYMKDNSLPSIY